MKIRAKKSLGQNFLVDIDALIAISSATEITEKNIVEVGPWYGALTDFLLQENPKKIDLVELDSDMIAILRGKMITDWADFSDHITLHHADVLKFSPNFEKYSLIANIPYYITSPILFHFLYPQNFAVPEEMVKKFLPPKVKKRNIRIFRLRCGLHAKILKKFAWFRAKVLIQHQKWILLCSNFSRKKIVILILICKNLNFGTRFSNIREKLWPSISSLLGFLMKKFWRI